MTEQTEPKPVKSYREQNFELAEKFDSYLGARGFAITTRRGYKHVALDFCDFIRAESVAEVEPVVIRQYIAYLCSRGCTPKTIAREVYALRSFFGFLGRTGVVDLSPLRFIRNRRLPKRLPRSLTEKRMDRLLDAADDPREKAIVEVAYATGCRIAELSSIRLENLNFEDGTGGTIKIVGKGGKEGMVYFGSPAARAIKAYLNGRQSGFLFQRDGMLPQQGTVVLVADKRRSQRFWWGRWVEYETKNGKVKSIRRSKYLGTASKIRTKAQARRRFKELVKVPREQPKAPGPLGTRTIRNIIYRVAKRAGLGRVNPHAIRHSFATHLVDGGADLVYVSKLMRHENINTTAIYLHTSTASLRRVYDRCHPRSGKGKHDK